MTDRGKAQLFFAIACLVAGLFTASLTWFVTLSNLKEQAIQYGYAEHDPKTGAWHWIVPKEQPSDKNF